MDKKAKLLVATILLVALLASAAGVYAWSVLTTASLHNSGHIATVAGLTIYQGTNAITSLDWGNNLVSPSTPTQQVTVKNTGNVPLIIQMTTSNPSVTGVSMTWDQGAQTASIAPGDSVTATLTLHVPAGLSGGDAVSIDAQFNGGN